VGLLPLLAQETIEKDIWYPTILGILVVVAAVVLFCGSVYLLLGTNFGARLGFLVAFTGLMAFMVLLTALWVMTGSPLNTLKGRIPSWKPQEVVTNLGNAKTAEVRDVEQRGREVSAVEAANVKAAADENLVAVEALPGQAQAAETAAKFAQFQEVTEYKVLNTYEIGGSSPNPLDFELTHSPLFAVLEFCEVSTSEVPFGVAPPEPECASGAEPQFLVLERDLGSLRVPPIVAFVASVLLFGLGLLALHWRERDEKAAAARGALAPARS
jgi:hypothetical protein